MAIYRLLSNDFSEWSGDYYESGVYNGKPFFVRDSTHALYRGTTRWVFADSPGSGGVFRSDQGLDFPPTSPWYLGLDGETDITVTLVEAPPEPASGNMLLMF